MTLTSAVNAAAAGDGTGPFMLNVGRLRGGSSTPPPANTLNWTAGNFSKTQAAVTRVRNGTGRGLFIDNGDSRKSGVAASRATSPTAVMAAALATAWGIPISTNSCFGAGTNLGTAAAISAFDPRITTTGSPNATFNSFGGFAFRLAASGQTYTFAVAQADSIDLFYTTFSGNGTFNLYVDGVLSGSNPINCNLAASIVKRSITGLADTTHTLTIEWVSGVCTINGWIARRSTVPAIDWVNGGCPGLKADDWNTNGTGIAPRTVLTAVANSVAGGADLITCNLITNDENANADPATAYNTQLAGFITYMKTTLGADTMLTPAAWEGVTGTVTQIVQQAYRDAAKTLANSAGIPLYDLRALKADYTAQNAAGWMSTTVHENATGYAAEYSPVAAALAAVVT